MTTFDERERAEELRFARDEERRFRIRGRRHRLFGLELATGRLGLRGPDAAAFAKALVLSGFELHDDATLIAKVRADLTARGVEVDLDTLERQLAQSERQATIEVTAE